VQLHFFDLQLLAFHHLGEGFTLDRLLIAIVETMNKYTRHGAITVREFVWACFGWPAALHTRLVSLKIRTKAEGAAQVCGGVSQVKSVAQVCESTRHE